MPGSQTTWRRIVRVAAILACSLLALPATAQKGGADAGDPPSSAETVEQPVSEVAVGLLRRVHLTNRFQMQVGQLAIDKGERAKVRRLGERIMRDHRVADRQLRQLADSLDVSLPGSDFEAVADEETDDSSPPEQRMSELLDRLRQADGADFDRLYVEAMRLSHRTAIDFVSSTRLDIQVDSVRDVADDLLPILRQHQELAAALQHELERADDPES
jgi:predicted outer membrane protein